MDKQNMKQISGVESYGGGGNFKGTIEIEFDKFDALPEEIRCHIGFRGYDFLQKLREMIAMAWAKENEADKRAEHVVELTEIFKSAGFETIHVEIIDSGYCGESCCYKFPWIIATTPKGCIKLGWRKRVMNLDWSDSDLEINAEEMFKDEKTTKGEKYIHCWSKEKAIEYLKKLNSEEK